MKRSSSIVMSGTSSRIAGRPARLLVLSLIATSAVSALIQSAQSQEAVVPIPPPKVEALLKSPPEVRTKALTSGGDPCGSLTPLAIKRVIVAIDDSRGRAQTDANRNGSTGAYAAAARHNLDSLNHALNTMTTLQSWLSDNGLATPHVSNASAAYGVHSSVRSAVVSLEYARHWAAISAVYHNSREAAASFDLTTQAITLADELGAQGGRCFMSHYRTGE